MPRFRLDAVGFHLQSQPIDQFWAVFVNAGWEITRACGQRSHIGPDRQHAATLAPARRTARPWKVG